MPNANLSITIYYDSFSVANSNFIIIFDAMFEEETKKKFGHINVSRIRNNHTVHAVIMHGHDVFVVHEFTTNPGKGLGEPEAPTIC